MDLAAVYTSMLKIIKNLFVHKFRSLIMGFALAGTQQARFGVSDE
jgi:hypothetical protein